MSNLFLFINIIDKKICLYNFSPKVKKVLSAHQGWFDHALAELRLLTNHPTKFLNFLPIIK